MYCNASTLRKSTHINRSRFSCRRGFSLVEIMVVVVIIGLIAGMVAINVRGSMVKARQEVARGEIANIVKALESFNSIYARYPNMEEGLAILTTAGEKHSEAFLNGGVPVDPWGRQYQYNCPGSSSAPYEVISYGADGRDGGDGEDSDISSANLKK